GKCGENLTWTLDGNTLTISGTGAMYDYENSFEDAALNAPWRSIADAQIRTIVVDEGVTYIGSYAFTQMGLVTSVTLPDSLEGLGYGAFWGCSAPTAEYGGGHYLGNENNPFIALVYTDYYLTTCTVHPDTKIIGSHAFEAQEQLTEVSIPAAVKLIGYGAFSECDALTDVYYNNTEAYWNDNVTIEGNNDALTGAAFHFSLTPATVKVLCDGVELCEAEPGTVVRLPVPETIIENGGVRRFYTWGVGGKICDDVQIGAFDANNETPNHRTYTLKIGDSWWTQVGERKIELTPIYFFVGDVTGDGLVTVSDLASMKSMIAGAGEYSGMAIESADVYFDGLSALSDISYMKSMLAGSYTPAG
ncbi:MAG: leucine-rich repeat protein, partial [Clostridia bacterium]|nr:leucine-rich repeat protein [Clostridia bacterium]